jgi:large-conductance mechanosensitive channel
MLNKFYNLDFGMQMIIFCVSMLLLNQVLDYSLSLINEPNTFLFNFGAFLSIVIWFLEFFILGIAVFSVVKYFKLKNK